MAANRRYLDALAIVDDSTESYRQVCALAKAVKRKGRGYGGFNPASQQDIDLFAGCAHDLTTCDVKFDAVLDYGGFPFVPRKNPFNVTLRGGS